MFCTVCCSALQCVAVCCSVLQCVAVCCSVLQCLLHSTRVICQMTVEQTHCNTLQHAATQCNTRSTLQHTVQHTTRFCKRTTELNFENVDRSSNVVFSFSRLNAHCNSHCRTHCNTHYDTLQHAATHTAFHPIVKRGLYLLQALWPVA